MKKMFILLFSLVLSNAKAATWYVNDASTTGDLVCTAAGNIANTGASPASPKATIAQVLGLPAVVAGDIIYVETGFYSLAAKLTISKSVTVRGAGGYLTEITGSNITLLEITAANVTLEKLYINKTGTTGVTAVTLPSTAPDGFVMRECTLLTAGGNGLEITGTSGNKCTGVIIEKSTFEGAGNNGEKGIRLVHTDGAIIRKNHIHEFHSGCWLDNGNLNAKLHNNYLVNLDVQNDGGALGDHLPCGFHIESASQTADYYHNSLFLDGGYTLHFQSANSGIGTNIQNNILSNGANGGTTDTDNNCVYAVGTTQFATFNYNCFNISSTTDIVYIGSTPYSMLADVQAGDLAVSGAENTNSIAQNPRFIDEQTYNLDIRNNSTGVSPCFMKCPIIGGITDDIYSVRRPDCGATPVAMGADDNGCKGKAIYAASNTTTTATEACVCTTDGAATEGWTYYANSATPDSYILAVKRNPCVAGGGSYPNDFRASVSVTSQSTTAQENIANPTCTDTYQVRQAMPRAWNATVTAGTGPSSTNPVEVRFFFPPAEKTNTLSSINTEIDNLDPNCLTPPANLTNTDWVWFKGANGSANYSPSSTISGDFIPSNAEYALTGTEGNTTDAINPDGLNYVDLAGVTGFSGGGGGASTPSSPLPIELLSFTGKVDGKQVILYWTTATEINNKSFVIEHSTDGTNYKDIGTVAGNGNTSELHDYKFMHVNPTVGQNYYRLRQIDLDNHVGIRTRSISIKFTPTMTGIANIYPNPTESFANITIIADQDKESVFEIFDLTGKKILSTQRQISKGLSTHTIDVGHIRAGAYILRVVNDSHSYTERFIIK